MENFLHLLLLLALFGLEVAAQNGPFTIDAVTSQIDEFLKLIQNGTLATKDDASISTGCSLACSFINYALPGQVSFPESAVYEYQESRYWSYFQSTDTPICRFAPINSFGVSLAVLTVQVTQCEFAVKCGGHGMFSGASNIDGGLTIDLLKLTEVVVSADQTQTSVGSGNRWVDVYNALEPKGIAVIGGRVADIGVGGLTLGGGMSFFSGRYGWACDNVNTYEVVFADGSIHEVSYSSYPDLYFALRGGGNNFGIVSRFDLVTFPQGDLWAGSQTYLYSNETAAALNDAVYWLNVNAPSDPFGQVILAYAYVQSFGAWAMTAELQYGKPVAYPPILSNFTKPPGAIATDFGTTNLTALTISFNNTNPGGFRETYWTMTVKNSPTILNDILNIFMEEINPISAVENILPAVVYQPLTNDIISHFSKNGGNALGITTDDGPLILINIAISWSLATDDAAVLAAASNTVSRANATAYAQGVGFPFLYQNYAALQQPVFEGYGQKNLEKLRAVSEKYDPLGVWQKLQPGYFKIF